jgi:group I intron endonuclease
MIYTEISELNEERSTDFYTIYSLVNLDNNKRYIGRSKNPKQRITQHFVGIKGRSHPNPLIQKESDCRFGFEILEKEIPFEKRTEREKHFIRLFKTYNPEFGYNANDPCINNLEEVKNEKPIIKTYREEMIVNFSKIRRLRKERGMTQRDLAEKIGHGHKSEVCKIETGAVKCTLDMLNRIAGALGCSPLSLILIQEIEEVNKVE